MKQTAPHWSSQHRENLLQRILFKPQIIALLITTLICTVIYWRQEAGEKDARIQQLKQHAELLTQKLDLAFIDINSALVTLQQQTPCSLEQRTAATNLLQRLPMVSEIRIGNRSGEWLCNEQHLFSETQTHLPNLSGRRSGITGPDFADGFEQPVYYFSRQFRHGEISAILNRTWLEGLMKYYRKTFGYLAIVNSDTGIPKVVRGHFSLPLQQQTQFLPINQMKQLSASMDNRKEHFSFAIPLTTQPDISVIVSEESSSLFAGTSLLNPSLFASFAALFIFFHLLTSEFLRHARNPARAMLLACQRGEFFNVYQPVVDTNRDLLGVEVLMRWQHPVEGLMPPNTFIPFAEENGLIQILTRHQINAVVRELEPILTSRPNFRVAINISINHLTDSQSVEQLLAVKKQVPGLVVEITEEQMFGEKAEQGIEALRRIHNAGILIALDDFGTGYCGLSMLTQIPLNALKADRSFIAAMGTDAINSQLLQTIVDLGHQLDLRVVAEGVETEQQAKALDKMGVEYQQGWYHGRPMRAEALLKRLQLDGSADQDQVTPSGLFQVVGEVR